MNHLQAYSKTLLRKRQPKRTDTARAVTQHWVRVGRLRFRVAAGSTGPARH